MKIEAKELFIILIGTAIPLILTLFFGDKLSLDNPSLENIFILLIIAVIFIIYVVYRRIGELGEEIVYVKEEHKKLEERLKIHQQLTNIEARIIALEDKNGKKKNR